MRTLLTLISCGAYFATGISDAPLGDSNDVAATFLPPSANSPTFRDSYADMVARDGMHARRGAETEYLQILLRFYKGPESEAIFEWFMFQGPRGVAVNPCGDGRFRKIVDGVRLTKNPDNWYAPPFPEAGLGWPVSIPPLKDCRYESSPRGDNPGQLKCGNYMIYDLLSDPERGQGTKQCGPYDWHSAWYVEY